MWRSRGNWDGLHILVLLQTDFRKRGMQGVGQGCAVAGNSSVPPSVGADLGAMLCAPPFGSGWMEESDGAAQS